MKNFYGSDAVEKLYDFDHLEDIAAGDPEFLISLAQIYLDTIPAISTEMVKAAKAGDWMQSAKLAHKLKSTLDSMNMTTVMEDVRTIEFNGKNKVNTGGILKLAEKINTVVHEAAAQLKEEFAL